MTDLLHPRDLASTRALRYPGAPDAPLTLDTWQDAPHNRWAFSHVEQIVPTVPIPRRGTAHAPREVDGLLRDLGGIEQRLIDSYTDALVVRTRDGIVGEYYREGVAADSRHLLMSVSKSICGLVIGVLVDRGLIDPTERVDAYVHELGGTAYGDARVQHVLDMTVDVDYDEDYRNPASHVQKQDRVAGWRPRVDTDPEDTYAFLASLNGGGAHGEVFRYCSAGTDVLAWVIESVTGNRYADVVSDLVWSRLGADHDALITVDRGGFAFANGGMACTARDLSRVGMLMLDGGEIDGERTVSAEWVRRTIEGADPELARGSILQNVHPQGAYSNQWWVTGSGEVYAIGIHGQYIWVDLAAGVVITKFSAWPEAVTEEWNRVHAELFRDVTAASA